MRSTTDADVEAVFAQVPDHWKTTAAVVADLRRANSRSRLTRDRIRAILQRLAEAGRIERDKTGASLYWRLPQPPRPAPIAEPEFEPHTAPATAPRSLSPYVDALERAVTELRAAAAAPAVSLPLGPITVRELMTRTAEHPVENLLDLDAVLSNRIARRVRYDTLVSVLRSLDRYVEAARENHDAGEHREDFGACCGRFYPDDVADVVTGAAHAIGLGAEWRARTEAAAAAGADV
jgi:hypothetical protein